MLQPNNDDDNVDNDKQLTVSDLAIVFADIEPIVQDDGPVCRIDYRADFCIAYNYMRAILHKDERSARSLQLTSLCLSLNPANYTVWHFRRLCCASLGVSAERELGFAAHLGGDNPKNYQVWYHRRAVLQSDTVTDHLHDELVYIAHVLAQDGKNYHAWSHRQFVVQTLAKDTTNIGTNTMIWDEELAYTDTLLQIDARNNSAWNHRWFVVHQGGTISNITSTNITLREADYAMASAKMDPYNESPWRYLLAVLKEHNDSSVYDVFLDQLQHLHEDMLTKQQQHQQPPSAPLLSAMCDLLECKGDASSLDRVVLLTGELATQHDVIRQKYWTMRQQNAQDKRTKLMME
jgi:protein farnesyltransferase/geranylgeranyltransferase type-1 subunit alpha